MVSSAAPTVSQYLASLPTDRRAALARVRDVVRAKLPRGYEEGMQYGMISWFVPLSRFPQTHNGQPLTIASLASQKNYMAIYLMAVYGDPSTAKWFKEAFAAAGKKLDMGKSCVRFKTPDELALDVIGEAIGRVDVATYLACYAKARAKAKGHAKVGTKAGTKKAAAKKRRS